MIPIPLHLPMSKLQTCTKTTAESTPNVSERRLRRAGKIEDDRLRTVVRDGLGGEAKELEEAELRQVREEDVEQVESLFIRLAQRGVGALGFLWQARCLVILPFALLLSAPSRTASGVRNSIY